MAVGTNTVETYDSNLIREDLQEAFTILSPTDCPFIEMAGTSTAENTLHEWPVVALGAVNAANRVIEGEDAPTIDAPNTGLRMSNITQISTKTAKTSSTSEAVNGAANNIQNLKSQIALRLSELKRDMETMLTDNVAASAGSSGAARASAGFGAFLRTNTSFEVGGADPTLSGTTEGYPNAAATDGTTPVVFAEDDLNSLIQDVWTAGGSPSVIMCEATNKRRITQSFTGNASGYRDAESRTVINAVDMYASDFGDLAVVPNRFMRASNATGSNDAHGVYVIDPEYIKIAYLNTVTQKPLATTGLSESRLIHTEYTLQVDNEAAHGMIRDTNNAMS